MIKKMINKSKQFIMFGIVGASNTAITFIVYYSALWLFKTNHIETIFIIPIYQIAFLFSFILSSLNGYYWSSRYVFKKGRGKTSFFKFYMSYIFTYLLSAGLMYIFVDILKISENIAPVLSLCVTIPINFLLNKYWTFRVKKETE